MATRRAARKKPIIAPEAAVGAAFILGVLYFVFANASTIIGVLLLIAFGAVAYQVYRHFKRNVEEKQEEDRLARRLADALDYHENALISYYHQSRDKDLFGGCDESRWQKHIDKFLETQVVQDIPDYRAWRRTPNGCKAARIVDRVTAHKIALQRQTNPLARIDALDLTPSEYERFCGDLLRQHGWDVRQTPATRDGGADLVAEKGGIRLVVQCKRYSHPVGNKAVQEVTSAVRLYSGNVACVVAPTSFTRQARQEATGLDVHLLHHSALPAFAEKIGSNQ